ncbi:MAG TPA: DUF805 domain-containing protein [Burkholderiales bacterium]|nr:DUF805 domain-containing protein [Burkholderiales bacterium]
MAAVNPYQAPRAKVDDQNTDEEFQDPKMFAVSGRLGRLRYIGYSFALYILIAGLMGVLMAVLVPVSTGLSMVVMVIGWVAIIVTQFMLAIQRCHDFNMSGWLSLISLIPFAVLVFWFVPGTDGPNQWGPKVRPNTKKTIWLALAVPICIFLIGILAAIALPAYQDYVKRAQQVQQR